MGRYILTLVLMVISLSIPAVAQKQNNIWYFGANAGIDFNTSPPTPLTNSAMQTNEGSAVVSDTTNGSLLFYTNGVDVWNRFHTVMPNGSGLNGGQSATQSSLIIPTPGNPFTYYIFTSAQVEGNLYLSIGIQYSIVDMRLDGGKGDVTTKNVSLLPSATEKLTAIPHCNGQDIWVIAHTATTDEFCAYLVTATGVSQPVVSAVGPTLTTSNNAAGYLQASPDGRRLVMATYMPSYPLQIYDFDNVTGVVSNAVTLSTGEFFYGVCFSPDNSKLYATALNKLYQYDLSSNVPADMAASQTLIYQALDDLWALQLGPDRKVYLAWNTGTYVGVINQPNALGVACNYVHNGISLAPKLCRLGLPNRVVSSHQGTGTLNLTVSHDTTICAGREVQLLAEGSSTYQWSPSTGLSCTTCPDPIARPATTTTYTVTAPDGVCVVTASVTVTVLQVPALRLNNDTTICIGDSLQLVADGATSYRWEPEEGLSCSDCADPVASPSVTTQYTVIGSNAADCTDTATVMVVVAPKPVATAGPDTTICSGSSVDLHADGGTEYLWEPPDGLSCTYCNNPVADPKSTTTYRVSVRNADGCADVDSVTVTVRPPPDVDAGPSTTICSGGSSRLAAKGAATYSWTPSDGLSCTDCPDPLASPETTRTYTVVGTDDLGCSATDTVTIFVGNDITALISTDTSVCHGSSVRLLASGGATYRWSPTDGLSCTDCPDPIASPDSTTTYTVIVGGGDNCPNSDSVSVTVTVLSGPTIIIAGDSTVCIGGSTHLVASGGTSYRWSPAAGLSCTDCPDPIASPGTTTIYTVVASDTNGCIASRSIAVSVADPTTVDAGDDLTICLGSGVHLSASGAATYRWTPTDGLDCADCPDPTASPTSTTTYHVVGTSALGCSGNDSVTVTVTSASVDAGRDTIICLTGTAFLTATSDADDVRWSPEIGLSCPTCASTEARPDSTTDYVVTVVDRFGCTASDTVTVAIDPASIVAQALIARDHRLQPASSARVPIELIDPIDAADVHQIVLNLSFDPNIIRLDGIDPADSLLNGWTVADLKIDNLGGTLMARLVSPNARPLLGSGTLLWLRLRGFLGSVDFSELPFTIDLPDVECTAIRTEPGAVRLDSICGLNLRLIETSASNYALDQNRPNPFNPTTEISFSLGLDGPTVLEIYDATGRRVATLVDEPLNAGRYVVTWDASDQASGAYYYRLRSGTWSRTGTMTLAK